MKLADLARMSTATTGTGTITLGSAASGYLTFAQAGILDGELVEYAINDGANSEIGYGTYTSSGTTLTRNVTKSTNSNSEIILSGSAQVFISPRAEAMIGGDGRVITPEMYGAKGDGVVNASGGAITAGTNSFTQSGYTFVSGDAGKYIAIDGAGAAGATLATTISSVSAGAAILAVNASTTVTTAANEWGTDDTDALKACAAACANKAVWFGPGKIYFHKDTSTATKTILFSTGPFVIYGNRATVKARADADTHTTGIHFTNSAWTNGPTSFSVKDLYYDGNRTRRVSTASLSGVGSGAAFYCVGCREFSLENLKTNNTAADGIYIGGDTGTGRQSGFFSVTNCIANDAGRNGYSVVGAVYGNYTRCISENHSYGSAHSNISYGWDFEPDASTSSNGVIRLEQCICSSCTTTGFGSNLANGTNTNIVWGNCYAEACGVGFYESAVGTVKVYAAGLSGNTTNFTNLSEKISGF